MRIVDIREIVVPIQSQIRNAYIDFSQMTVSVLALITDVSRQGKPVVGYAEHVMRKCRIPLDVYTKEVAGKFNPEKFDAKAWAQLAHTLDELAPGGKLAPPAEMIRSVVEAVYDDYAKAKFPNYEQRREDLNTLANFSKQYESAGDFLDQLALLSNLDHEVTATANEDAEMLTLSSVHQAKGLEWKVVFVIWMADGMFPSSRSLESDDAIEEERRLFYVAVTRAKDDLYLIYPYMRRNADYGEMMQRPSRFLAEVPKALLEEWQISGGF